MTDDPERIWIYHHSDQYENPVSPHMPTVGCLDDYTSYVRDDLYAALEAENARLRKALLRVWDAARQAAVTGRFPIDGHYDQKSPEQKALLNAIAAAENAIRAITPPVDLAERVKEGEE